MQNLFRLLKFRRRTTPSEELPLISLNDREKAIQDLKATGRIDVDRYLEAIDPKALMAAPVGPTADCLTIDDVEAYAKGIVGVGKLAAHLSGCSDCRETVRLYKAVQEDDLASEVRMGNVLVQELGFFQIAPTTSEFSFVLQTPQAIMFDALELSAQGIFEKIDCQDLVMIREDASVGYTYRARCVAHTSPALVRALGATGEICGWINVSGKTKGGRAFSASDLLCARLKP